MSFLPLYSRVTGIGVTASRCRREAIGETVREKVDLPAGCKLCRTCGESEPHGEWHRDATASDGLSTHCKA
ncbi:hypothetical protein SHIRM173S_11547 [Streptomyces hirsutus]